MRRTLLIAEGTFHRPVRETLTTVVGLSVTLLLGIAVLRMQLPGWLTLALIAALLVGVAVLKARFGGPREFRIERPTEGDVLRLTGRFDNGEVPVKAPRTLSGVRREGDTLVLEVNDDGDPAGYRLSSPAFSTASQDRLAALIRELPETGEQTLLERYRRKQDGIRAYDARSLLLVRFTQAPGFMLLTWAVAAATVALWLLVLTLFIG
ncbi:hypothetical protein QWY84_17200 [Aquisalimonas lutea]|uniref:hypothetical protein n=1 Tax=Aquisalimonas lutea TaxID=1327750 RepID=UPI0025B3FB8E|nr:hypothetical protein [Aquisalimonas lutea]MDN3519345.1 hypothetical protein [Aquisalimonas lutea]